MRMHNQDISLRDILTLLFKHKTKIVATFALCVVTGVLLSFLLPPVYEANTRLLVKIGREYLNRPAIGDGEPLRSLEQHEVLNSEIQILSNRELMEKVIKRLTLEYLYPDLLKNPPRKITPLEAAIRKFEKSLDVEEVRKSNVIQISFRHKDPQVAVRAVKVLVELFQEKHLQVFSETPSSFLESKLTAYREKLKASQEKMDVFKQRNQVVSLDEQKTLLLKQRTDLDTSLKTANHTIRELQGKMSSLKTQKAAASASKPLYTESEREKIIVDAKAKLLALQLEEQDLLKKYREDNRLVVNVRNEIKIIHSFLKEQEEDITVRVGTGNKIYQEMELERIKAETDLQAQRAKVETLEKQLARLDTEIRLLDLSGNTFGDLKRDLSTSEKYYQSYVDRFEEARISEDMNRNRLANIAVIQEPAVPGKPIRPRKIVNILLSMFVGGFSGLGFAICAERISQGLTTPESAERRLGLPVLTAIPYQKE